jgi:hypothetical protein
VAKRPSSSSSSSSSSLFLSFSLSLSLPVSLYLSLALWLPLNCFALLPEMTTMEKKPLPLLTASMADARME